MKEANLGDTVRRLRQVARLSLRALAQRAGFSASFISQVENGQASPSIASMERIALALGVSMGQIFEGAERPKSASSSVTRLESRVALTSNWSKARLEALGGLGEDDRLEPVLLILGPGGSSGTRPYSSTREEFAYVLQGSAVLSLEQPAEDGAPKVREYELHSGDAVTIRQGVGRRWQNPTQGPVHVLMVSVR